VRLHRPAVQHRLGILSITMMESEHSLWLSLMRDRLEVIRHLLSSDGSLWITIDDTESHYLKVLCDEVFGRMHFVSNVVGKRNTTVSNDAKWLSEITIHVLVYAVNKEEWRPNRLERTTAMDDRYRNPDLHPKGIWKSTPCTRNERDRRRNRRLDIDSRTASSGRPREGHRQGFQQRSFDSWMRTMKFGLGSMVPPRLRERRFLRS